MTKIAILHPFYDILGGAEKLSLTLTKALVNNGYEVDVITITPINEYEIKKLYGYSLSELGVNVIVDEDKYIKRLRDFIQGRFVRLRRLMIYKHFIDKYIKKHRNNYDILIETQSNIISNVDLSYIHYPVIKSYFVNRPGIHWRLYGLILKYYINKYLKCYAGKVVTNSSWTAAQIYSIYKIFPDIIHPPVDVNTFIKYCKENGCPHNEYSIVTISRFTPEKKLDKIVDIAKQMPNYTFYLIGSTNKYSRPVLDLIKKKIEQYDIKNVIIKTNVPLDIKLEIMSRARYYLHPPFPEHFGISIVEAMSIGLIPIVFKDGGGYYDIISKLDENLGYTNIEEIIRIIRLIDSSNRYDYYSRKAVKLSHEFSSEKFSNKMLHLIRIVEKIKKLQK